MEIDQSKTEENHDLNPFPKELGGDFTGRQHFGFVAWHVGAHPATEDGAASAGSLQAEQLTKGLSKKLLGPLEKV